MSEGKVHSTTLKWALPVRVDKLVAHFEAYVETLPTIHALRMCERLGSGPQCYLSKLPTELVDAIEESIVEIAREEKLHRIAKHYSTWKTWSNWIDEHLHDEGQHALFHSRHYRHRMRQSLAGKCTFSHDTDEATAEEMSAENLSYASDDDIDDYAKNGQDWHSQLQIFDQHRALLQNHFGLDVWTAHVRFFPPKTGYHGPNCNQNHTVAYLTLPQDEPWQQDEANRHLESQASYAESKDTMPVSLGGKPAQTLLRKFTRALKLLGLEVHVERVAEWDVDHFAIDWTSEEIDDYNSMVADMGLSGGEPDVADAGDGSPACWPQLTVLSRCLIREGGES